MDSFAFEIFEWPDEEESKESQQRVEQYSSFMMNKGTYIKNSELRFVIGLTEKHSRPGRGPSEANTLGLEFRDLNKIYNWRMFFADNFEGNNKYEMSFTLHDKHWNTVTHYMLGMMYINSPEFMILFSLDGKNNENGFWGSVNTAIQGHLDNTKRNTFPIDPEYQSKLSYYLYSAYLAKFTQNPIAKKALLLTGDALIAKRTKLDEIIDVPEYSKVRDEIRKNPRMIYFGEGNIEEEFEIMPTIDSAIDLNPKILGIPKILKDQEYEILDINEGSCIIYNAIGVIKLNLEKLVEMFGEPKLVKRNVYGMQLLTYDSNEKILIGLQENATSIQNTYKVFSGSIGMEITLYVETFENGFGLFIISSIGDNSILDFLKMLLSTSGNI